ncbi:MAG: MMPL family transporter [Dehalococcoidia bacterium]|nr:MMPL family transporter [Dehalococcoidia bacterium]
MQSSTSFVFDRYPRFAVRRPWHVLAVTVLLFAAILAAAVLFGGSYSDAFSIPNAESQRARDLLQARFPEQSGDAATVVVKAPAGINDPQVRARVEALDAKLRALPDVVDVASPYAQPATISKDGTIARINVQYDKRALDVPQSSKSALEDLRKQTSTSTFQVETGGAIFDAHGRPGNSELVGVAAAVIILLIAFGSVVAMGLPIVTALLALGSGLLIVTILARSLSMPAFTPQFGAMIGLGVGIDYALLTVTRFREGLAAGHDVETAVVQASATAGRSVLSPA